MADFDDFAKSLFEEAKRFWEKGRDSAGDVQAAYFHAAVTLGFSALEAHVNAIAEEMSLRKELTINDLSILLERESVLTNGEFKLGTLKIYRLQDRIEYLLTRFSRRPIDKTSSQWLTTWSSFSAAAKLRNSLIHPKEPTALDAAAVQRALTAILGILQLLYQSVYRSKYPGHGRGLDSVMNF